MIKKIIVRADGGSRGNPGPAAIGVVLEDESGNLIREFGKYIGETTNNQAEYQALFAGLEEAKKHGATEVKCYLDSELVVKQLNREYKIKDANLGKWFIKIWNISQKFTKVTYTHILRGQNKRADWLLNQILDRR
ncbi:MAG: ribonuclease HI family protein [Patescibacteria group bacterium]